MKIKLLLFLLFYFLVQFVSAQNDIVYNGRARIEIRVKKISVYDLHDRHGGAEARVYFEVNGRQHGENFAKTVPKDRKYWITMYSNSEGWLLYGETVSLNNQTVEQYVANNNVRFEIGGFEYDADRKSGWQYSNFTLKSVLNNYGSDPGYHTFEKITESRRNFKIEMELSITPPPPTLVKPGIKSLILLENEQIDLSVKSIKDNIDYEWCVNTDNEHDIKEIDIGRDYAGYRTCMQECLTGKDNRNGGGEEPRGGEEPEDDMCMEECDQRNRLYRYENIPIWRNPKGSYTIDRNHFIFKQDEFSGFTKHYIFRSSSVVRVSGRNPLRSLDSIDVAIVDVFPRNPIVKNLSGTKVSCNQSDKVRGNQKRDGSVSFEIDGDFGQDVDGYRVSFKSAKKNIGFVLKANSKTVEGLPAGNYEVSVSNYFIESKQSVLDEKYGKKEYPLGHYTGKFLIREPEKLIISSSSISIVENQCGNFKISDLQATGGNGSYTYSLDEYGDFNTNEKTFSISDDKFGKDYKRKIWVKDAKGCIKDKEVKINLSQPLQINAEDNSAKLKINCYGKGVDYEVDAQDGYGPYSYKMDGGSFSAENKFYVKAGQHRFYVKDRNGCVKEAVRTFSQNSNITIRKPIVTGVNCHGDETGKIEVNATGGIFPYTISLSPTKSKSNIRENQNTNFWVGEGAYNIKVVDAKGCEQEYKNIVVNQPSELLLSPNSPKYGKYHFKTHNSEEEISLKVSGGYKNNYKVKYLKNNTIKNGKNVSFFINEVGPIFQVSDEKCKNKQIHVDLIKPELFEIQTRLNKYISSDNHTYNIKNRAGKDTLWIDVKGGIPPYNVSVSSTGIADRFEVKGGKDGKFFVPNLSARTYTVHVATTNNYESIDKEVTLKEPELLKLEIELPDLKSGMDIKCRGEQAVVTFRPIGGINQYTLKLYKSNVPIIDEKISDKYVTKKNLTAGKYKVVLFDKYKTEVQKRNFTILSRKEIVVKPEKTIAEKNDNCFDLKEPIRELNLQIKTRNHNGYQIKCNGGTDFVDLMVSGGVGSYIVSESSGKLIETNKPDEFRYGNLSASKSYSYTIKDANDCLVSKKIELQEPKLLVLSEPIFKLPSCHHKDMGSKELKVDGEISTSWEGGAGSYTLSLIREVDNKRKTVHNITDKKYVFKDLLTGFYTINIVDGNNCRHELTGKKLKEHNQLIIDDFVPTDPTCYHYSDGKFKFKVKGGVGNYQYSLDNGSYKAIGASYIEEGLKSKKNDYVIGIKDKNGCFYERKYLMNQPDSLVNKLIVLELNLLGKKRKAEFDCYGSSEASELIVKGGTANYTSILKKNGVIFQELKNIPEECKTVTKSLHNGTYSILTTDSRGCKSQEVEFELKYPREITFSHRIEQYEDNLSKEIFDYRCNLAKNAINLGVTGGFAPYEVTYIDRKKKIENDGEEVDFLIEGKKPEFVVKDNKECKVFYKPILNEPNPIKLLLTKNHYLSDKNVDYNIKCYQATDTIWAEASGGIRSYTYELFLNEKGGLKTLQTKISNGKVFFSNLSAGNYLVKATGNYDNSCYEEVVIELHEPAPLKANVLLSNHNGFQVRCKNFIDSVKVEALGGISPYLIELKGEGKDLQFDKVSKGINTFKSLKAGTYKIRITDKFKACEYNRQITLIEPSLLDFKILTSKYEGGYEIRCSYLKDSVQIVPSGSLPASNGSRYEVVQIDKKGEKSLGHTNLNEKLTFRNLGAGQYSYVVTDENGCSLKKTVKLYKPDSLKITNVEFKIPTCHENDMGDFSKRSNGEIKVAAQGGVPFIKGSYDFLLDKISTKVDSIRRKDEVTFKKLETGEYTVRVRDFNSCMTVKKKQFLLQPSLLHIDRFRSTIPKCYGTKDGFWTSKIKGGTSSSGNYTYSINLDGELLKKGTTASVFNHDQLGKGNYIIEINDDLGCYYRKEKEILQPDPIEINFDVMGVTTIVRKDGVAQARINGGNGTYRYQWYHRGNRIVGATSFRIENLSAGIYTVEVWDKYNCPYGNTSFGKLNGLKKSVTIEAPGSKLGLVAVPIRTSYIGASNGAIKVSGIGGWPFDKWPGYEFSIDGGSWSISSEFRNLRAGNHQVRVRDRKGVIESKMVVVEEPDKISIAIEKQNCLCFNGKEGNIQVNVIGGTPPYTFALNEKENFSVESTFSNLFAGNYEVFVKDKLGNIEVSKVEITQPEELVIKVNDITNSTCNGNNGSAKLLILGGEPDYNIDWGAHSFKDLYSPSSMEPGNYRVVISDQNKCTASKNFRIEDEGEPKILLKKMREVSCHDLKDGQIEIKVINAQEPLNIVWEFKPNNNSPLLTGLGKGKYKVTVSDANNCFDKEEYEVTGPEPLNLIVNSLQSPNCVGLNDGYVKITGEGGSPSYKFIMNDQTNSEGIFANLGAGSKNFGVIDSHGCKSIMNAELSAPVPLSINLPKDYYLCVNQREVINSEIPNSKCKWFYEGVEISNENEVDLFNEGNYILRVRSEKGCEAEHSFKIHHLKYNVNADFIVPAKAILGDTIIAVDISWELPDSIQWKVPKELELLSRKGAAAWFKVKKGGNLKLGLNVFKKECTDYIEKDIKVAKSSSKRVPSLVQPEELFIKEAVLFPNPNRGNFNLKLQLSKIADVSVDIFDMSRAVKLKSEKGKGAALYTFNFNDRSVFRANNVYSILIKAGRDIRRIKFVVY